MFLILFLLTCPNVVISNCYKISTTNAMIYFICLVYSPRGTTINVTNIKQIIFHYILMNNILLFGILYTKLQNSSRTWHWLQLIEIWLMLMFHIITVVILKCIISERENVHGKKMNYQERIQSFEHILCIFFHTFMGICTTWWFEWFYKVKIQCYGIISW